MNTDLFWAYVALAAVSKWLTVKQPTSGEKLAALLVIVAGALVVAWIVPQELNAAVVPVLAVFHGGEIAGRGLSKLIDKIRVLRAVRSVRTRLAQVINGGPSETNR